MGWYDISMPIGPSTPCFPGDPPLGIRRRRVIVPGGEYAISEIAIGSHTGTHVDAPAHFLTGGRTVDLLDLDSMNGPCHVLAVPPDRTSVGPADIDRIPPGTERLLLRTRNSERWATSVGFFSDYVALTDEGAERAEERGLVLVGIDSLSVERPTEDGYLVHRRLLKRGTVILEGLLLNGVPEGAYGLRCLPLRIAEGDGAPARAALVAR